MTMSPIEPPLDVQDTVFTDPESLQDTVKSFLLSENFPHVITFEEILRICKILIMLL